MLPSFCLCPGGGEASFRGVEQLGRCFVFGRELMVKIVKKLTITNCCGVVLTLFSVRFAVPFR